MIGETIKHIIKSKEFTLLIMKSGKVFELGQSDGGVYIKEANAQLELVCDKVEVHDSI